MKAENKGLFVFKHDYPELDNHAFFAKNFALVMKVHSVWFILGFIGFEYFSELFSFDLAAIILVLMHRFIALPLMQSGKIPAYYRADYSNLKGFLIVKDVLVLGAFIRWGSYVLIIAISTLLTGTNISDMQMHLLGRIGLNEGVALAVVLYISYMLYMYYLSGDLKIADYAYELKNNLSQGNRFEVAAMKARATARQKLIKVETIKAAVSQAESTISLSQEQLSNLFSSNQQSSQPNIVSQVEPKTVAADVPNTVELNKPKSGEVPEFTGRGPRQF